MTTFDPQDAVADQEARADGSAPTGIVGLRNFDEGMVVTLGAEVHDLDTGKGPHSNYFLTSEILPVEPAPGLPGVPITFSHPEDIWERYRQPVIVIRRDDISPAMNRWHPHTVDYRAPARGATEVTVIFGEGTLTEQRLTGYDRYEEKQQAVPFDITYTISVLDRHRGKGPLPPRNVPTGFTGAEGSPRNQVNRIFDYVLRRYPPYGQIYVTDSLGDRRRYSTFMEAVSHLDEVPEITERVLGFALTVRVEAELDLSDPEVKRAVSSPLTMRTEVR
jgi:hypothetical protein